MTRPGRESEETRKLCMVSRSTCGTTRPLAQTPYPPWLILRHRSRQDLRDGDSPERSLVDHQFHKTALRDHLLRRVAGGPWIAVNLQPAQGQVEDPVDR